MVIVILAVLGLCLGSFVNAFVWRFRKLAELREREQEQGKQQSKTTLTAGQLSISKGRSMCVHCHHELAATDLVPVFSYLWLRGRCRYCRKPIQDTPLAELLTPALFIVSYLFWPFELTVGGASPAELAARLIPFIVWLVCLVGFVALSLYDWRWQELPHRIVLPLIGLASAAVAAQAILSNGDGWNIVARALLGALVVGGIFWLLYAVSPSVPDGPAETAAELATGKRPVSHGRPGERLLGLLLGYKYSRWIGFGDVTLGVLLGLLVGGPGNGILLVFVASLIGTLVALPLLLSGKATRGSHLAFGPFLMAAAVIVKLWGDALISWYAGLLLV